jgi:nicotinate phosphoribosyltransferase
VDTSESLVDESLAPLAERESSQHYAGVNPHLVRHLRDTLDHAGFPEVGIIVSGGFTPAKIRRFEEAAVPVTGYGVGSSLLGHNDGAADGLLNDFDFTADVVMVNGRPESKVGRGLAPNPRMVRLDLDRLAAAEGRAR